MLFVHKKNGSRSQVANLMLLSFLWLCENQRIYTALKL